MSSRIILFDIEATSLEASFGHVLCFGYKLLGGKTQVPSLADLPRPSKSEEPDARLLKFVHKVLTEDADIIVSWYGKEYDRKFLNSRMLMVGLPPLPPLNSEHVDLYFTARGNLKLHANRLQSVSEALGCPYSKTPVRADIWRMAMREDPQAMRYIIDHCKRDVDILEWCYMKLRPFVRQHPRVSETREACRVWGKVQFESSGILDLLRGALQTT